MNCELFITWNPDIVALDLGFFAIRWYSLCWCVGLVAVYMLVHHMYRQQKISEEQFDPQFMYCFIGIIVGARLGHCLFYEPGYYLSHPLEMVLPMRQVPGHGWTFTGYEGLASHGGAIGLITGLILYARAVRLSVMRVLDNVAIVTPLCTVAIRIGNLMNSEIIGSPTDVPWAFVFERVDMVPRHPGQLYEALCYAACFAVTWTMYRRHQERVGTGYFFGLCLCLLFPCRFLMEFTKENQVGFENGMLMNMGQLLSIPFLAIGIYYLIRGLRGEKSTGRRRPS